MRPFSLTGLLLAAAPGLCSAGFLEDDVGIVVAESFSTVLTDVADARSAGHDLRDCLSVPTFPGKCTITGSPGACYSLPGDADQSWQCWTDTMPPSEKTDSFCQQSIGKRGACKYADHGKTVTDADLPSCLKVPGGFKTQCHPVTNYWGACYKGNSDSWMCIDQGNPDIDLYRLNCKVTLMPDAVTAYDGACTFKNITQKVYKCPTVPTYDKYDGASSCLGPPQAPFACFSLTRGSPWQCMLNGTNPSCGTTLDTTGKTTYDGACVNDNSPDYDRAEDASGLTTTTTTTTTTTSTTTTTTTSVGAAASLSLGIGSGFVIILSFAAQVLG